MLRVSQERMQIPTEQLTFDDWPIKSTVYDVETDVVQQALQTELSYHLIKSHCNRSQWITFTQLPPSH